MDKWLKAFMADLLTQYRIHRHLRRNGKTRRLRENKELLDYLKRQSGLGKREEE